MNLNEAKSSLDKIIDKARVHLYKPIQIAEILYRDRVTNDIKIKDLETYRTSSRKWRDLICIQFLGRTSTSSARYQDDLFNDNAVPPKALFELAKENRKKNGIVEAYIYSKFKERFGQLSIGLDYCYKHNKENFDLQEFINIFWAEPGLRRSIDKVYEIVVYSLFSSLIDFMKLKIEIKVDETKLKQLEEFKGFAEKIIGLSKGESKVILEGRINRLGVTNAADRGLDMWANFGLAIQVKHLSLTEELAESIVGSVTADRIVIICKDSEEKIILSVLNQLGWKSRVQSIVTESELLYWYDKALRGENSHKIADSLIRSLISEIESEFPSTNSKDFDIFINSRNYDTLRDDFWQ